MKRGWLAVLAAAALAGGCSGHHPAGGDHDALDYANAYYRNTMARLLWPHWQPLTRLAARAACRTARMQYRIANEDIYAARFASRAQRVDVRHGIVSDRRELEAACVSGLERPAQG